MSKKFKTIKETLYLHCKNFIIERQERVQTQMATISESLTTETKSSAGDKHETGRAMLQLEREKAGRQWAEVQKLEAILGKTDIRTAHSRVRLGSLVTTTMGNYFICISAGAQFIDSKRYDTIATNTPIGMLILGKREKEYFTFRDKTIQIIQLH